MVYSFYIFLSYSSYTTALTDTINLCNIYYSKQVLQQFFTCIVFFNIGEKTETNKHLEEPFYLPTNTWIIMVVCLSRGCWMSTMRVIPLM